jgi:hypothetical protein
VDVQNVKKDGNPMHDKSVSQHDAHARAHRTSEFPGDGLFSHPDSDHADVTPGPSPVEGQRSYTGLFREPADGPRNTTSAA